VWPEGLSKFKIPVTSSGIGPAPYQMSSWCFNQVRFRTLSLVSSGKELEKIREEGRVTHCEVSRQVSAEGRSDNRTEFRKESRAAVEGVPLEHDWLIDLPSQL
jgi:hypothetical protein